MGPAPLRRLTAAEYDNTVRDLLGITTHFRDSFSADERIGAFRSNGLTSVGTLEVEQYQAAAESVAAEAVETIDALVACDPGVEGDDACAQAMIDSVGLRVYRRPLHDDEREMLGSVFTDGQLSGAYLEGIRRVLEVMLQSPAFLYHLEFGDPAYASEESGVVPLSSYELASRLSYLVWNSMPDDELLAAAASGELGQPEGIIAQFERMTDDHRALDAMVDFHLQWMAVDDVSALDKDAELFPEFDDALAHAMQDDARSLVSWVFESGTRDLKTLLTADFTLSDDPRLLALYGVTAPDGHTPGEPISVDPE